jgi:hypothetical protein
MNYTQNEPMVKNSNQVHTTKDYFLFKSIDGNRTKNNLHVKRLLKSMEEKYLFNVIIVNENYEIIDGQHRFECIKKLELPMHYIVCEGYGLPEVHKLNANSKNWKVDDFLTAYCDLGMEDYIMFRDFKNKYKFGVNECFTLLVSGGYSGEAYKVFSSGKMKIKSINEAEYKANLILSTAPYYKGYLRRYYVFAINTLLGKPQFDFNEFIQKLKQQPTTLVDCTCQSAYIELIEEIYNYRRREKINLRF